MIAGKHRHPDLAWPDVKVALEAQGPHHLLPKQRALDLERDGEFTGDGWVLVYATEDDLDRPDELVASLKRLIADRSAQLGHGT